jgi:hypothetical protein
MNRYQIVETAFGYGAVAFTVEPFGLLEVKLPHVDIDVLCRPFDDLYWQIDNSHPAASSIAATLVRYFEGEPISGRHISVIDSFSRCNLHRTANSVAPICSGASN